ncbi:hypothetical protein BP5796_12180 [Coleophoma crateriformis]|uniref:Uncharacterized protein n=1 Tax=Coleophoma crateriformis TaxID=565419 RepID=A0A3D8QBN1_9HELO|nr:hypothetical protein BP5796_12180 [Coleophoma crateriformis]
MGDFRSSTRFPESNRRRRAPNELVWTQPRTLPAFLHKNARSFSTLPKESSNKDSKARTQPVRREWQQESISKSLPSPEQTKDVFDWIESDFLDLAGVSNMTDSAPVPQNSMDHTSSSLDTTYLTTPQSMDQQQSYPVLAEAGYGGSLVPSLADDDADDSNSYMPAAPDSSLHSTEFNGFSAIHLAAYFGKFSVIQLLLSACPEALNLPNKDAETPLHIAVSEGHVEVVSELLRSGANPSLQDANRRTPLHLAVLKEHLNIVRLLLDDTNGQDMIRFADYIGRTPLHHAVQQGCSQIIQILLEKGADPRMPISKVPFSS